MNIFLIFFLPVIEVIFLGYITAPNYVLDFNYLIPCFIGFYALLSNLSKANKIIFKTNRRIISFNLFLLASYIIIILMVYKYLSLISSLPIRFLLMILGVLTIFTSLIAFIDLSIFKKYKLQCLIFFPLSFTVITYPALNSILWTYLSSSICKIVGKAITLLGYENIFLIGSYTLKSPYFKISIHSPCSGLEGILMFITVFSVLFMLRNDESLKPSFVFISFIVGIFYMYTLNIIRIVSYFLYGMSVASNSTSAEGAKRSIELFHSNVGWILYFIGIAIFIIVWIKVSKRFKSAF